MEFVDAIKKGDSANNGSVSDPDKIISLKVAADVEKTANEDNNVRPQE